MGGLAFKTLGGAGEDLVLVHGFGADRLSWIGISPELMTRARVHALDLPGHGESASADPGEGSVADLARAVHAALSSQGIGRLHLLGHSLGGAIAMRLAADEPDRILSLALIAPAGLGRGPDPHFLTALPALSSFEEAEALLKQLVVRPQLINKLTVQRLLDHLGRDGVREALARIGQNLAAASPDLAAAADVIGRRDMPRLVLWGAEDRINPIDEAAVARFGGALCRIDPAGHLPHIEAARQATAALLPFYRAGEQG
jgi:pyruvate dehydrogenase E2 component (dihydrolipoamide acetyltransferase)